MYLMITNKKFSCSFCKRHKEEVDKLIVGKGDENGTYICSNCVNICYNALKKNQQKEQSIPSTDNITSPKDIYEELCKNIYGQEEGKKYLSVAAYNHIQRIKQKNQEIEKEKSNILLIGKSGSGKTLLVESLSKILKLPCISIDATSLTKVGYVGQDVSDCIQKLFERSNYNIELTEKGIIFIDEFDKIRSVGSSIFEERDISGKGVQQSLLKLIEDSEISVSTNGNSKFENQETVNINTKNILFIFAGHFSDLQTIIQKEQKIEEQKEKLLSLSRKKENYANTMKKLNSKHLEDYGIIKELIGRIPVKIVLEELTEEDFVKIMSMPKGILEQFKKRFSIDKVNLEWNEESLREISKIAYRENVGARALKSVLEKIFLEPMFDINILRERYKIILTSESIKKMSVEIKEI